MKNFIGLGLALSFLIFGRPAFSQESFHLFGGFDLGFSNYSEADPISPGGVSRSGFHGGLRLLGSFYTSRLVFDGGLGWHWINSSGEKQSTGEKVRVNTRGSYLEFSPRYRLTSEWQLGPVLDYWLSTDNGLNSNALLSEPSNRGLMAGAQLVYEWKNDNQNDDWRYRFGARALTGLNVDSRSIRTFQVYFQMGFPPGGSGPRDRSNREDIESITDADVKAATRLDSLMPDPRLEIQTEGVPVAKEEKEVLAPIPVPALSAEPASETLIDAPAQAIEAKPAKKFVVNLNVDRMAFGTASAKLPPAQQKKIKKMGQFLAKEGAQWESLNVVGHTDERGSNQVNNRLSTARAKTVRDLLIAGGVPAKKVKALGRGERFPLDRRHNDRAWARNRRVELDFRGVKNMAILYEGARAAGSN